MTWPRWCNLALGFWLLLAPLALDYVDPFAVNNDRMLGVLVTAIAVIALWLPKVRYVNVALGLWLVISLFVLGYLGPRAIVNDIVVGIAITLFSLLPSRPLARKPTEVR